MTVSNITFSNKNNWLLSFTLVTLGSIFFVLGIDFKFDGFFILFVPMVFWLASLYFNDEKNWISGLIFILTSIILFMYIANSYVDSFLGFFLVIMLILMGLFKLGNNPNQLYPIDDNNRGEVLGKKLCQKCGIKIDYPDNFCKNCGEKSI